MTKLSINIVLISKKLSSNNIPYKNLSLIFMIYYLTYHFLFIYIKSHVFGINSKVKFLEFLNILYFFIFWVTIIYVGVQNFYR
jgi:hypothetical protein